jgi:CheY-like chemotaxis protein
MRSESTVFDPSTRFHTPTILCIDDDPHVSEVIHDQLDAYDVKFLQAFFGSQGIWMAVRQKPDVVICDLRMPQGDGATVIECLKRNARTAAIPIVVLTARHEPGLQQQLEKIGASSCLTKPIHFNDLLDELQRHIEVRFKAFQDE